MVRSPPSPFETLASLAPQDEGGPRTTPAPQDEGGSPSGGSASATSTAGGKTHVRSESYRDSGVDTAEADAGLNRIIARVQKTWPAAGLGRLVLPIGYFANVIELDGIGLALCTDGVG